MTKAFTIIEMKIPKCTTLAFLIQQEKCSTRDNEVFDVTCYTIERRKAYHSIGLLAIYTQADSQLHIGYV